MPRKFIRRRRLAFGTPVRVPRKPPAFSPKKDRSGGTSGAYGPSVKPPSSPMPRMPRRRPLTDRGDSLTTLYKLIKGTNSPGVLDPGTDLKTKLFGLGVQVLRDLLAQKLADRVSAPGRGPSGPAIPLFTNTDQDPTGQPQQASTAATVIPAGRTLTEKPILVMAFALHRKQSSYLKKVSGLFATKNKQFVYQSFAPDYRYYTTGLNAKGLYYPGDVGATFPAPLSGGAGSFNDSIVASRNSLPYYQDNKASLCFSIADDMVAVGKITPPVTASPYAVPVDQGNNLRWPFESRTLSFEINNLNRYLNGHFTIIRLTAKSDIYISDDIPETLIRVGLFQNPYGPGLSTSAGYLGSFQRLTPRVGSGMPPAADYNAGFDLHLEATPGLSRQFKASWDISEVRKFILRPDQTAKISYTEQFSNGLDLSSLYTHWNTDVAIPAGRSYFMIMARTNPTMVERCVVPPEEPIPVGGSAFYGLNAQSGFLSYKVSNIAKVYSSHIPAANDPNSPWEQCLGTGQQQQISLSTSEYAAGNYLNPTGTPVFNYYQMPVVTTASVQFGGPLPNA